MFVLRKHLHKRKMRQTLCIVVLFAVSAFSLHLPQPHNANFEKCKTEQNITDHLSIDIHSNPEALLKDPATRCLMACFLRENKTLKPDGTLNADLVAEKLPSNVAGRQKVVEAFMACANETGIDNCERAYKTALCINSKEEIRNIRPSE